MAVLSPPPIADLHDLICTCIFLYPSYAWWCQCLIVGGYTGLLHLWTLWNRLFDAVDFVLSSYFQLSIDRSFDILTWHPCEVAVRVSRCEPDKRNHQRICKGNIIQTDQDWFRRIQVLLLRQSEETSWTDCERQWSKMIGVCSCQLLKRSCCAMSLNEKPPHPPCCAKDDTPALAGDEQYKEWKDSLSVRTQVHERCAN